MEADANKGTPLSSNPHGPEKVAWGTIAKSPRKAEIKEKRKRTLACALAYCLTQASLWKHRERAPLIS